jgi:hypothetical protein
MARVSGEDFGHYPSVANSYRLHVDIIQSFFINVMYIL